MDGPRMSWMDQIEEYLKDGNVRSHKYRSVYESMYEN